MADRTTQHTGQLSNVALVYNIYRIVLPLVLLVTFISNPDTNTLGTLYPRFFVQVTTLYAIFAVAVTFFLPPESNVARSLRILSTTFAVDIIAITVIAYSSGGIESGLGFLLMFTIASASILVRGRLSIFLAAFATLAMLGCEFYLSTQVRDSPNQFLQAGILGAILFATSFYLKAATNRIYNTALLADRQASDIIKLEKLNNEIIQRMRTGIAVADADSRIITLNAAAAKLFATLQGDENMEIAAGESLPAIILNLYLTWKADPAYQPKPFTVQNPRKQIQTNFAFLRPESNSDVLIFIEDNRLTMQRVRQAKLASLGRLTASIAHEIRNPLGAISHATQLLKESDHIAQEDVRMVEIILKHCDRVNQIVEDILGVSRHHDTVSRKLLLKDWLQKFIGNYCETHQDCGDITLQVEPADTRITLIPGQLEQVLNNLFDNGLRYSLLHTGKADLTLVAGADISDDDYQPYLHIIDEGPGIDEEAESQLFEPFHTTDPQGTGLGLYISKELCEANQSQLAYSRTESGKSCFSIYFAHPERSIN